jgi:hypothetical protein
VKEPITATDIERGMKESEKRWQELQAKFFEPYIQRMLDILNTNKRKCGPK